MSAYNKGVIQASRADLVSAKRRVYWRTNGLTNLMIVLAPLGGAFAKNDWAKLTVVVLMVLVAFVAFRLNQQTDPIARDLAYIVSADGAENIEFALKTGMSFEILTHGAFHSSLMKALRREAERNAVPTSVRCKFIHYYAHEVAKEGTEEIVKRGLEELREIESLLPPNEDVRESYDDYHFYRHRIEAIMAAPQPSPLPPSDISRTHDVHALRFFALDDTQAEENRLAAHARILDLEGKSEAYNFIETEFRRNRINRQYAWRYFWKSA